MVRFGVIFLLSWIVCVNCIHTLVNDKSNIIKPKKEILIAQKSEGTRNQYGDKRLQHSERYVRIRSPVGAIERPNVRLGPRRDFREGLDTLSSPRDYSSFRPLEPNRDIRLPRPRRRDRIRLGQSSSQYRRRYSENPVGRRDESRRLTRPRPYDSYDHRNEYQVHHYAQRRLDREPGIHTNYGLDTNIGPIAVVANGENDRNARISQVRERSRTSHRLPAYRVPSDPFNDLSRIKDNDIPVGSPSKRPLVRSKVLNDAKNPFMKERNSHYRGELAVQTIPMPTPRRITVRNKEDNISKKRQTINPKHDFQKDVKAENQPIFDPAFDPLKTMQEIPKPSDIVPRSTPVPAKQQDMGPSLAKADNVDLKKIKGEKAVVNLFDTLSPDPTIQAALKLLVPLLKRAAKEINKPADKIKPKSAKRKATETPPITKELVSVMPIKASKPSEQTNIETRRKVPDVRVKHQNEIIKEQKPVPTNVKREIIKHISSSSAGQTERPLASIQTSIVNSFSDILQSKDRLSMPRPDLSRSLPRSRQKLAFFGEEMEEIPGFKQGQFGSNRISVLSRLLSAYSQSKEIEESQPPLSSANGTPGANLLRYFRSMGIEEIGPETLNKGKNTFHRNARKMGYVPRDKQLNEKLMGESEMSEGFANMFMNSNIHPNIKEPEELPKTGAYTRSKQVQFIQLDEGLVPVTFGRIPTTTTSAMINKIVERYELKTGSSDMKLDSAIRTKPSATQQNDVDTVGRGTKTNNTGGYLKNLSTPQIIKMLIRELTKLVV